MKKQSYLGDPPSHFKCDNCDEVSKLPNGGINECGLPMLCPECLCGEMRPTKEPKP